MDDAVRADAIVCDEQGVRFHCHCFGSDFEAAMPVIGRHNVYNALAAIAVGHLIGLSIEDSAASPHTAEWLCVGTAGISGLILSSTIHITPIPASMAEAIRTLDLLSQGTQDCRPGGIGRMGDSANGNVEPLAASSSQTGLERPRSMGNLAKDIAAAAQAEGMTAVYTTDTHEQAARQLQALLPGAATRSSWRIDELCHGKNTALF